MSEIGLDYAGSDERLEKHSAVATFAAKVTAPVLRAALWHASKETNGQPLMTQPRIGKGLQEFGLYKVVTLGSDSVPISFARGTIHPLASVTSNLKRITAVDELPQLRNVAEGDMALTGLRPFLPNIFERLREIDSDTIEAALEVMEHAPPGLIGPGTLLRKAAEDDVVNDDLVIESLKVDIDYMHSLSEAKEKEFIKSAPCQLALGAIGQLVALKKLVKDRRTSELVSDGVDDA